jgi:hypothetical protein
MEWRSCSAECWQVVLTASIADASLDVNISNEEAECCVMSCLPKCACDCGCRLMY